MCVYLCVCVRERETESERAREREREREKERERKRETLEDVNRRDRPQSQTLRRHWRIKAACKTLFSAVVVKLYKNTNL